MTTAIPATSSAPKGVARTDATSILRVTYEDGTGDLTGVVLREPEGLSITGAGTIPSPLTVEIAEGWTLIRTADLPAVSEA